MLVNELAETLPLDGPWDFSLGENVAWTEIPVPGCWEAAGHSMLNEGPAHYRRRVRIPAHWAGQTIRAEFDAVSYACTVRLNGIEVGQHRGLWTPFTVDLTAAARPGEENTLEVDVYKPGERYPMRSCLAGFLPDVATSFGGIWQPARLRAFRVGISDLCVRADAARASLHVHALAEGCLRAGAWQIELLHGDDLLAEVCHPVMQDRRLDLTLPVPGGMLWSPERPFLYTVRISLLEAGRAVARASERTGLRCLSAEGDQLLLNGQPFMVRGILSWGWNPDRIAPAYTVQEAREEMRRVRALGFNTIKLCLFVPNQAYYDAADEEGMLLWQEWPMWLPEVTPELRAIAPAEYTELTRLTRHHPSVALYTLGCELNRKVDAELLARLDEAVRAQVSGALICDNSGSGESYGGLDFDLADFTDYHPYCELHYFEPLLDNWRRDWRRPRPWILGEFCDSDTFRDPTEVGRAMGGRPWWRTSGNPVTTWRPEARAMVEAEERLAQAFPGGAPDELTRISYAQSLAIRKYTLEALRRREGIGGYVITGLRDTPIATSGIFDDLGRAKWSPEDLLPVNGDAVLTLDVPRRRQWSHGGDRPVRLDPHNHWAGGAARWHVILSVTGEELPATGELRWALLERGGVQLVAGSGRVSAAIAPGAPREVGVIDCQLPQFDRPVELRLEVTVSGGGLAVSNSWPVWVYPPLTPPPPGLGVFDPGGLLDGCGDWLERAGRVERTAPSAFALVLATAWSDALQSYLAAGGHVLLLQQSEGLLPIQRCPFWREAINLFADHPVWQVFPQRGYTDLQFFGLAGDAAFTGDIDRALPDLRSVRPLLRRLDARLFLISDYLLEMEVGRGILLACTLRLQGGMGAQPFGWQRNVAGAALLHTLLNYLLNRRC